MKILFVIPSYKPAYIYGGPVVAVSMLAERLIKLGHDVTVYTTTANGKTELEVEKNGETVVSGVKVFYFERITKDHTHVSISLWRHLNKTVKDFDVVHLHSWWNFLILGAAQICKRNNVIPILSPRGMFSDYVLESRNSAKKRLIHNLLGKRLLKNVKVHATAEIEWNESQQLIPNCSGIIIPNLVKLPENTYQRKTNDVFTIGFLSRIHDKKGLDLLIRALSKVSFPYELIIAGDGDKEYVESLQNLSKDCGNENSINWVGWKNGEEKFQFLAQLDLFALTSQSENFALVVIESLSVGTPVLISNQVGLRNYVADKDCGWVCGLEISNISEHLENIYKDINKLEKINNSAPSMIMEDFEESKLATQYVNFYNSLN